MKTRLRIATAFIAGLSVVSLSGCGGQSDDKAGDTAAKKPQSAPEETTKGGTQNMTGEQGWEKIAEQLGVDLDNLVEGENGLKWIVREEGTGDVPTKGQTISAHYTGYLLDGTKFDSSVDRGQPFQTPIGVGRVIKGWDMAFTDMKVGEKRLLFIPPELGYGPRGAGGVIPPNATLVFDVQLLDIVK